MKKSYDHMENLLKAVNEYDYLKIWIMPNNDAGSNQIKNALLENRDSIVMFLIIFKARLFKYIEKLLSHFR